jgi:hypothetical protein
MRNMLISLYKAKIVIRLRSRLVRQREAVRKNVTRLNKNVRKARIRLVAVLLEKEIVHLVARRNVQMSAIRRLSLIARTAHQHVRKTTKNVSLRLRNARKISLVRSVQHTTLS